MDYNEIIKNGNQPLACCEVVLCKEKSICCVITGKPIKLNEEVFRFRLFNRFQDLSVYATKKAFKVSPYWDNYTKKYLANNYKIDDFREYKSTSYSSDELKQFINNFNFEKTMELLATPNIKLEDLFLVVTILIKSGFKERIIKNINDLPDETSLLFSLLDDRDFQNEAAKILKLEKWPKVLNILRKKKLNLDDMLFVVTTGEENPELLKILAEAMKRYKIHYPGIFPFESNCFEGFNNLKNCRLCYLFISSPLQLNLLKELIETEQFPQVNKFNWDYLYAYYFRAVIFYFLLYDYSQEKIMSWMERMPDEIEYYHAGDPSGFIKDTFKLVKQYLKRKK